VTDITTRLRTHDANAVPASDLMDEAAGEIDRLRSRLRLQDAVIRSGDVACLTQAEREALEWAIVWVQSSTPNGYCPDALRGLLDRLGPVRTAAQETVEE
jgi:hypothetical protein